MKRIVQVRTDKSINLNAKLTLIKFSAASSGSVLQKFKKTLSHFKGGKTNGQVQENIDTNNEPKHHR